MSLPLVVLLGELDDQDGVLRGETHEGDDADLDIDVVLKAGQGDAEESAEDTDRQAKQDRERNRPAFVLRGEDQEHEDHGHAEDRALCAAGLLLLVGEAGPFVAVAVREALSRLTRP